MQRKRSLVGLLGVLLLLALVFCERVRLPLQGEALRLEITAEAVLVTEVWLRLEVEPVPEDGMWQLWRGDSLVWQAAVADSDTVAYDGGLLPNHSYTYRASLVQEGKVLARSKSLALTTMDTTSHNYEWEIFTFGTVTSTLRDVSIIDEKNIWAVGAIYSDSSKTWLPYNAVHWDGEKWELRRIQTNACGGVKYPPIRAILAFSDSKIVFAHIDASITRFNGKDFENDCSFIREINGSINAMWGTSSDDLYIVGNNGLIAHYDGRRWRRLESGVETMIQDIWGAKDLKTGEWVILYAVSPGYGVSNSGIYQITGNHEVQSLPWIKGRASRSIWFNDPLLIYACGSGILRRTPYRKWEEIGGVDVIPASTERIRGIDHNDIFVVGHFGYVAHFNGVNFNVINPNPAILYESCDYKANLMVAVGYDGRNAFLLKMWRTG